MEQITQTTAGQNLSQDLNDMMGILDLGKILPKLDSLVGKLGTWVHLSMFLIPFVMAVLGIWYLFFPPKEANRHIGFRSMFAMGSPKAWAFAQRLAGFVWSGLGLGLMLVMLIVTIATAKASLDRLVSTAIIWLIIQMVLVLVSYVGIQLALARKFDYHGMKRSEKK